MSNVIPWPGQVDQDAIAINFFEKILPPDGLYCACVKKSGFVQTFHETIESLWAALREGDRGGRDVYFAVASFSSPERTIECCAELRSLRLDIDFGAGHARAGYATYEEANDALKAFLKKTGLPVPMVVRSGGGFHVHWSFKEALPVAKWLRYAEGLKQACLEHGLVADHGLTINPVVILRPPGTFNRKLSTPRLVELDPAWLQFGPYDWPDELLRYVPSAVVNRRSALPIKPEFLNGFQYPEGAFQEQYERVGISALATVCGVAGQFQESGDVSEPVWMRLANLLHYVDDGENLFHRYSQQGYPNYNRAETQRKWDRASALTGPPLCKGFKDDTDAKTRAICLACPLLDTIKTPLQGVENDNAGSDLSDARLAAGSRSDSIAPKKAPYVKFSESEKGVILPTFKNAVLAISKLEFACRHDIFHVKKSVDGDELTDAVARVVREKIIVRYRFDPGKMHTQEALDAECERNPYDPVADYLNGHAWDGVDRLQQWLCRYLGAEPTPLNCAFGRKVLLAAVRRVRQPGCKFDHMLVLEGVQGLGKSSAWRILAGDANFSDEHIKWDDPKQQKEAATGVWIHEIAEMVGLRKADMEAIKSFLSRQNDRGRAAYDRYSTDQPRRGIHVGTINPNAGYWNDPTGGRRLWPVKVYKIDLSALRRDRDQLWAEAAYYEAQGEALALPPELYGAAAEQQTLRRVADPWEDILGEIKGNKVSNVELMQRYVGLENGRMSSADGARIASIMRRMGWEGPKVLWLEGKTVRGYERSQ